MGRGTVQRRRRRSVRHRRQQAAGLSGTAGANATWVRTARRGSDTYLEVMPDLTQGVDEEQTWLELQEVRCQPLPLSEKRRLKRQLLAAPTLRTRGWQAVHLTRRKLTKRVRAKLRELLSRLELWRGKFRYIEGNFGTGLVAFFTFIKWLLFLNFFMSVIIAVFIVVPQFVFLESPDPCEDLFLNGTDVPLLPTQTEAPPDSAPAGCCHVQYRASVMQRLDVKRRIPLQERFADLLLQGLEGSGELELSPVFYGFYNRTTMQIPPGSSKTVLWYQLPLAYLFVMLVLMAFCLIAMVKKAAKGLRESLRSTEGEFYQFCNLIFGGWDFCIENSKAAAVKHRAIYNELCTHIETEKYREEEEQRTRKERVVLYMVRLLVNIVVLAILAGSIYLVWSVTAYSFKQRAPDAGLYTYNGANLDKPSTSAALRGIANITSNVSFFQPAFNTLEDVYDDPISFVTFPDVGTFHRNDSDGVVTVDDTLSELTTNFITDVTDNNIASSPATRSPEVMSSQAHDVTSTVSTSKNIIPNTEYDDAVSAVYEDTGSNDGDIVGDGVGKYLDAYRESVTSTEVSPSLRTLLGTSSSGKARGTLLVAEKGVLETGNQVTASVDEVLKKGKTDGQESRPFLQLVYRYLPTGTIVALNIIVPMFFNQLVLWERYSTNIVLRVTLVRTVLLRLLSLGVLLFALHDYANKCPTPTIAQCDSPKCAGQVLCWETYVGQELYKLTLLDLAVILVNTFVVNFMRKVVGQHMLHRTRVGQRIGAIEFEIPKHVLDIVYGQTLCWLGMFYAPLLPAITCVKLVLVFYIKYFDCSFNSSQSSQFYRTSRSNALFISILLISFIVTSIPVGYSIVDLKPSLGCGPFRGLPAIWTQMVNLIAELPWWMQSVVFYLGTAGFAVPAIVLLSLLGYYYFAVAAANKHLVQLLKGQLVLEGHDKQFLLNRLDQMIKSVNEEEERHRSRGGGGGTNTEYSDLSQGACNDMTLQIGESR